jgi:hypothetical protein
LEDVLDVWPGNKKKLAANMIYEDRHTNRHTDRQAF